MGRRHMGILAELLPGIRFSVVREGRNPNAATTEFNASVAASLEIALAEKPDFAVVATPPSCHRQALRELVAARVPFYVEKPVAESLTDLEDIAKEADAASLVTFVGCNLRFLPSLGALRRLISARACGEVVRAHFECGQWLPDWRPDRDYRSSYSAKRSLGGGVHLDLIHELDMALWLLGDFPEADVRRGRFSRLEIDSDDVACLLLSRPGGPVVTIALDYVARPPIRQYRVVGTEGTLEWDLHSRTLRRSVPGGGWSDIETEADAFDVRRTYARALAEFVDCILKGKPSPQPLSDGIAALRLALNGTDSEPALS